MLERRLDRLEPVANQQYTMTLVLCLASRLEQCKASIAVGHAEAGVPGQDAIKLLYGLEDSSASVHGIAKIRVHLPDAPMVQVRLWPESERPAVVVDLPRQLDVFPSAPPTTCS